MLSKEKTYPSTCVLNHDEQQQGTTRRYFLQFSNMILKTSRLNLPMSSLWTLEEKRDDTAPRAHLWLDKVQDDLRLFIASLFGQSIRCSAFEQTYPNRIHAESDVTGKMVFAGAPTLCLISVRTVMSSSWPKACAACTTVSADSVEMASVRSKP